MSKWNFEWYVVTIKFTTGINDCEFKGKTKKAL